MGVDTRIHLPPSARGRDIANVAGILAGLEKRWSGSDRTRWVEVPGARLESVDAIPECARIVLEGEMVDGERSRTLLLHYEDDSRSDGSRLLMPRSTPFWIGVGLGLLKFFGGSMDFNDCDLVDTDYTVRRRYSKAPSAGADWDRFQRRIWSVQAMTKDELAACAEYAAYAP